MCASLPRPRYYVILYPNICKELFPGSHIIAGLSVLQKKLLIQYTSQNRSLYTDSYVTGGGIIKIWLSLVAVGVVTHNCFKAFSYDACVASKKVEQIGVKCSGI
jgi:hypothetical protein